MKAKAIMYLIVFLIIIGLAIFSISIENFNLLWTSISLLGAFVVAVVIGVRALYKEDANYKNQQFKNFK